MGTNRVWTASRTRCDRSCDLKTNSNEFQPLNEYYLNHSISIGYWAWSILRDGNLIKSLS